MTITLDHILALAFDRLDDRQRPLVLAEIARSSELAAAYERFVVVAETARLDLGDPVPASAIDAAKGLGRRLDALRATGGLVERLGDALRGAIARLVFDSRLDGPMLGLRGGTGSAFVVQYQLPFADGGSAELEMECTPAGGDAFLLVGQISGAVARRPSRLVVRAADRPDASESSAEIDAHGMVRMTLAAGAYHARLVFESATDAAIELPLLEIP